MKGWKKILFVLAVIAVAAIACFMSWSYGFRKGMRAGGLASNLLESAMLHPYITGQLANANCEGAKQALYDYLKHLEKYRDVKGSIISMPTVYDGDKMLTHIRLARIEEHLGNSMQTQKHMAIAKEACAQLKWEDCSDEKMVSFAERLEEKDPIGCLSNKKAP